MSSTVHVSGIASGTTEKEVQDFFSFCGKITSLSVTPVASGADSVKSASVTFEKDAAAKTALLLDQTQLGSSVVHVQAAQTFEDIAGAQATHAGDAKDENQHDLEQEDKPRSRIVAEYLAHGYSLSDTAVQRAIALDQKHGFSNRFTSVLGGFDQRTQASDRARGLDENYKLSDKATTGWRGLHSYFEKALGTPSGRKLRDFYSQTDKQVREVHNEARRLADLKSGKVDADAPTASAAGGAEGANFAQSVPQSAPQSVPQSAPQSGPQSVPQSAPQSVPQSAPTAQATGPQSTGVESTGAAAPTDQKV